MAPPRQVAAPPKGSISVGWLWVSFLNWMSQVSVLPSMVTGASMEQALISSLSSKSGTRPFFRRYLAPMVAMSIKDTGLSRPAYSSSRRAR